MKTKITLGITFLFVLIIIMGVVSIYYIRVLAYDTGTLIKDNQRSIAYVEHMNRDIGKLQYFAVRALTSEMAKKTVDVSDNQLEALFTDFSNNLDSEAHNITEPGEEKAANNLKSEIADYKVGFYQLMKENKNPEIILDLFDSLQSDLGKIYELNKKAIIEKNELESKTASKGVFYVTIIGSAFILVAFVFLLSFPSSIVPEKESL